MNRYKGSIRSATAAPTTTVGAYGIWTQTEAMQAQQASTWPTTNDPYFSSVSILLHGDGTNGAQNNTIIDSSANAFTITRNGSATQGTFTPFRQYNLTAPYSTSVIGGSAYFNGSTDYLSVATTTALGFGTGDYTVEFWIYLIALPGSGKYTILDFRPSGAGAVPHTVFVNSSGFFGFYNGSADVVTSSSAITAGTWNHVAYSRGSGTLKIFVNGTSAYSAANTIDYLSSRPVNIGTNNAANSEWVNGYISNLRIVKGTAVYTTTFTPPTAPLTAITNTSLLLSGINAGVYDNAMVNDLVTVGNAQISTSVFKYGAGSISFDGTGDWLTSPDNTSLQMAAGDFTIEGWVYLNAVGAAYGIASKGTATTGWSVNITSGNKLQFSYSSSNLTGATSLTTLTWYYFAVVRSGSGVGNLKIYLNGIADATSGGAVTDTFNQTNILYVGADRVGGSSLNGYIDDLRITKGVARYSANFTAPTAAFQNQ
jgi:hypothetical protein